MTVDLCDDCQMVGLVHFRYGAALCIDLDACAYRCNIRLRHGTDKTLSKGMYDLAWGRRT